MILMEPEPVPQRDAAPAPNLMLNIREITKNATNDSSFLLFPFNFIPS
jgi:hypothetical protein